MTTTGNPYRELQKLFIAEYLADLRIPAPELDTFQREIDRGLDGLALLIKTKFGKDEVTTPHGKPATEPEPKAAAGVVKPTAGAQAKEADPPVPEILPKVLEQLLTPEGVTYRDLQNPPFKLTRREAEHFADELMVACDKGKLPYEFKSGKAPGGKPGPRALTFRLIKRD